MKWLTFTKEVDIYALRQTEAGTPVRDVCQRQGVAEATFYAMGKTIRPSRRKELRWIR